MIGKDNNLSACAPHHNKSRVWWPDSAGNPSKVLMVNLELEHVSFEISESVFLHILKGKHMASENHSKKLLALLIEISHDLIRE